MYKIKALPLWAQRYIVELEGKVEKLNKKVELFNYHDHVEDIICGVDMSFSQLDSSDEF